MAESYAPGANLCRKWHARHGIRRNRFSWAQGDGPRGTQVAGRMRRDASFRW